ncbi:MAG: XdhC family protein [Pseudomonadota bacterium]
MNDPDIRIFEFLQKQLQHNGHAWLCTVVRTYGSSPRPPGSMMVCASEGALCGSLSGGCVEDDLVGRLLDPGDKFRGTPILTTYGETKEEGERFGLPCGGRLDVVVEHIEHDKANLTDQVLSSLRQRKGVLREVDLKSGKWALNITNEFSEPRLENQVFSQVHGAEFRLVLIGIGALAESLAEMALTLGYEVIACDPRAERVAQWDVDGTTALQGMPDDLVRKLAIDERSIVLTLSHDPRIDDMALMEALLSPAIYVGALGSVRTAAKRRERLNALDIPPEAIDRLHAPVGLAIGAKTPAEIAIAILAELTQMRRALRVTKL